MCQGFSHFLGFLHNFVLAKLATCSIRVKTHIFSMEVPRIMTDQGFFMISWASSENIAWGLLTESVILHIVWHIQFKCIFHNLFHLSTYLYESYL